MMKIILFVLLVLYLYFSLFHRDGFSQINEDNLLMNEKRFDSFYSKVYDEIYDMIPYHKEEINIIQPYLSKTSNVLCVNSRTGHINQLLSGITKIQSIESSKDMVSYSKAKYPNLDINYGHYSNSYLFNANYFTHIICPLFSIHEDNNIRRFFNSFHRWLIHKVYLYNSFLREIEDIYYFMNELNVLNNYHYSLDINNYNVNESIYKNKRLKRKHIWSYNKIILNNLIYYCGLSGFKFVKNESLDHFNIAIFTKN